jgi:NADH-quinone oxidoreductase subunit M
MMFPDKILMILVVIPALGSLVGALIPEAYAKLWALFVSLATAAVALVIATGFTYGSPLPQFVYTGFELTAIHASFTLQLDSISLWLVLLTAVLMPLAVAASFYSIKDRAKEYYAWMLLLQSAMLGVFVAGDLLLFYVFFELTLVPMFFIIGIWGGPERRYAAGKFFLFTFTGSVFTLAGAIYLGMAAGTFNIHDAISFAQTSMSETERYWLLLAFLAGFVVKVPLFPVHTWLPLAHTEAPTAGSVILAGVLLKLGTYGLLRLAVPIGLITSAGSGVMFLSAVHFLGTLCLIGIIYGALVAWVQQDIKKLVAYSSVSHLGFCVLGLLALNIHGIEGSVLYMINHGVSTGAMFLVIGMVYDRFHTRDIDQLSGLARRMPIFGFFFVFFVFSSIGLPGTNGFVSEFLTILGAFTSPFLGWVFGSFAALGIILGAVYMLHMTGKVIFGPLKFPGQAADDGHGHAEPAAGHGSHGEAIGLPVDLSAREISILVPLALLVLILGVFPSPVLTSMDDAVHAMQQPLIEAQRNAGTPLGDDLLPVDLNSLRRQNNRRAERPAASEMP